MDDIRITTGDIYRYIIYANIALGILFGSLSLLVGLIQKKNKYAILGFVLAIIGGALGGILLSYPITVLFLWLIVRGQKNQSPEGQLPDAPPVEQTES